jgi:hypothetical protein
MVTLAGFGTCAVLLLMLFSYSCFVIGFLCLWTLFLDILEPVNIEF